MSGRNGDAGEVLSAIFNNSAFADVAAAAHRLLASATGREQITTRMVASATGRSDSVVRPVMLRLVKAGLLQMEPKSETGRGAQYFTRMHSERWRALIDLVALVTQVPADLYEGSNDSE